MNKKYFVHEKGWCESSNIGKDTLIWAFTHIMKGAQIGVNCNIGEHCFIENDVIIGNYVTIKNGISIWDGVHIEDRVFLGPHMVFTNDLFPRSKLYHDDVIRTTIKYSASIGANATIICGVTIGRFAMIGAGSVVTKDIPDYALYFGNPAVHMGFVCECGKKLFFKKKLTVCTCGLMYKLNNNHKCNKIKERIL